MPELDAVGHKAEDPHNVLLVAHAEPAVVRGLALDKRLDLRRQCRILFDDMERHRTAFRAGETVAEDLGIFVPRCPKPMRIQPNDVSGIVGDTEEGDLVISSSGVVTR
jgi:hypothetical protein